MHISMISAQAHVPGLAQNSVFVGQPDRDRPVADGCRAGAAASRSRSGIWSASPMAQQALVFYANIVARRGLRSGARHTS